MTNEERDYEIGRIAGAQKEVLDRLGEISDRLDGYISMCVNRLLGMVAFVLSVGTFVWMMLRK